MFFWIPQHKNGTVVFIYGVRLRPQNSVLDQIDLNISFAPSVEVPYTVNETMGTWQLLMLTPTVLRSAFKRPLSIVSSSRIIKEELPVETVRNLINMKQGWV